MFSWFSVSAPAAFTSAAPGWSRGCQIENTAPCGSWITLIRPASSTSNGPASAVAPSPFARSLEASASSTVTYEFQTGGMPSCWPACSAPTCLPSIENIV